MIPNAHFIDKETEAQKVQDLVKVAQVRSVAGFEAGLSASSASPALLTEAAWRSGVTGTEGARRQAQGKGGVERRWVFAQWADKVWELCGQRALCEQRPELGSGSEGA